MRSSHTEYAGALTMSSHRQYSNLRMMGGKTNSWLASKLLFLVLEIVEADMQENNQRFT